MTVFSQTEISLNINQIENLEKYVGLNFPKEYKEHLLKYNGGQCYPNIFTFKEDGKVNYSVVDWFFAIYDGEYDNLKREIEMVKIEEKRMPTHILPIAHDPLGNLICISCGNNDEGYVYFWNHEKEVDYSSASDEDYSNLYLVAYSFNEFIDNLKENFE